MACLRVNSEHYENELGQKIVVAINGMDDANASRCKSNISQPADRITRVSLVVVTV